MHHTIDRSETVNQWDRSLPPRVTVQSGDTLTVEMRDASDGQVHPDMTAEAFSKIDSDRVHGLTGPIEIAEATPGSVIEIRILEINLEGWGWTAVIPGAGLLGDDFEDHFLQIWDFEEGYTRSLPGVAIPLEPFCGIVGVQRKQAGSFRTHPPGPWGGNMDVRHLTSGSSVFLPVFTEGAGLCLGDGHAAQGDGEVSVTGIEAPMTVKIEIIVHHDKSCDGPELVTKKGIEPSEFTESVHQGFIASAENPRTAAKRATRRAIDHIVNEYNLTREQGYVLCSAALRLKINQIVNDPMTTVTGYLPEALFQRR